MRRPRPEPVERATRQARRWADRYTRGVAAPARADRLAELESDLFEHRMTLAALPTRALARSIRGRTLRGVPADLLWRHGALDPARRSAARLSRRKTSVFKHRGVPVHAWVPIAGPALFDQTNGVVDITGNRAIAGDDTDPLSLTSKAAVSNMINVGFGGGI